jgi:hypothetical protein
LGKTGSVFKCNLGSEELGEVEVDGDDVGVGSALIIIYFGLGIW